MSRTKQEHLEYMRSKRKEPLPCNCGRVPHAYTCPESRREVQRRYRAKRTNDNNA